MNNKNRRETRAKKLRSRMHGTQSMPRLSVHRTNKYMYAQLINDTDAKTLFGVSESEVKEKGTKTEKAKALGMLLAEKAKAVKVSKVVFDRSGYRYHGRVKAFAEGAREGGLQF